MYSKNNNILYNSFYTQTYLLVRFGCNDLMNEKTIPAVRNRILRHYFMQVSGLNLFSE